MKASLPFRFSLATLALAVAGFTSGCAHVNEVLWRTADELQRQQEAIAYQNYIQAYYGPRPSSDTSAPGIK